jgi:hypothetical protein
MSFAPDDDEAAQEAHDNRIRRCSSCNARIIWFTTAAGRQHPVDADSVTMGDEDLDLQTRSHPEGRHISHFSTCPNAAKHRKPR